ncbi:hypothetical protein [Ruminiclostridium sufflavum]|uniref:hypothetical protein n=1 Tax=Ruminiclostridium sufflavum TaxID=396504 RepID=UPI00105779C5|nr:hypothetical protein [Ruminiclostridium sufflavum]
MIKKQADKIEGDIHLSNKASVCAYYKAPDCHFNDSTAGFVSSPNIKQSPILLLGILAITICAFGIALVIYIILGKMQIQPEKFAGIFAAITAVSAGLFTLVFNKISKSKI